MSEKHITTTTNKKGMPQTNLRIFHSELSEPNQAEFAIERTVSVFRFSFDRNKIFTIFSVKRSRSVNWFMHLMQLVLS